MTAVTPTGDRGLQPERTVLAWRRTVLALAVGSLLSLRLVAAPWGPWAGAGGLVVAAALWVAAERRARHRASAGAGLLATLAGVVVAVVVLALVWLCVRA
ncbi:DUF202 domain-containing protein [Actinosynnema sp. NPDC004786]